MVKVPKEKATAEFKAALSRFEDAFNQAGMELVSALTSQGWAQGEAENLFAQLVKNASIIFPPKGKDEIADEFLYGQHVVEE